MEPNYGNQIVGHVIFWGNNYVPSKPDSVKD